MTSQAADGHNYQVPTDNNFSNWGLRSREDPFLREIPSAALRAGSLLRLKNGSAQDYTLLEMAIPFPYATPIKTENR